MLRAMQDAGHTIHAAAGEFLPEVSHQLRQWGIAYTPIGVQRRGTDITADFRLYRELRRLIKQVKPDLVFSYTVKPVVYGRWPPGEKAYR